MYSNTFIHHIIEKKRIDEIVNISKHSVIAFNYIFIFHMIKASFVNYNQKK